MDVFHVGASAPKAPETRSVDRDAAQKTSPRTQQVDGADAFASSSDAAAVARHVRALESIQDAREDVIKGMSQLLGEGLLDTPDAAKRAAQGILDS
jgi:hypothetical protein